MAIKECNCSDFSTTYLFQNSNTLQYQVKCINCLKSGEESGIKELAICMWNELVNIVENCKNCKKRRICDFVGEIPDCKFKLEIEI